jgi:hypothetical protein
MFYVPGKLYLVFEYVEKNLLEVLEDQPQGELESGGVRELRPCTCHPLSLPFSYPPLLPLSLFHPPFLSSLFCSSLLPSF